MEEKKQHLFCVFEEKDLHFHFALGPAIMWLAGPYCQPPAPPQLPHLVPLSPLPHPMLEE